MRRLTIILTLTLAAVVAAGSPIVAQEFTMDTAHSHIGFGVRHLTVSTVRGSFNDFSATLEYDSENLSDSTVSVTIGAESIDTRNERRDSHLKSEDFFDVANHPDITFSSTSIAATELGFDVTGDLTIRGVTKEVVLAVEVAGPIVDPMGMRRMGISGQVTIDRTDFGVAWNRAIDTGGLVVGEEVKISLEGEFAHDPNPEDS